MMITIKQGIITLLVSFAVFFFMPFVCFASDLTYSFDVNDNFDDSLGSISYSYFNGQSGVNPGVLSDYSISLSSSSVNKFCLSLSIIETPLYGSGNNKYSTMGLPVGIFTLYSFPVTTSSGSNVTWNTYVYNGTTIYYRVFSNFNFNYFEKFNNPSIDFVSTFGCPIFYNNQSTVTFSAEWDKIYNYLLNDVVDGALSSTEFGSPSSLGYIKNVNYSHNNNTSSQGLYEVVSWGSTSTTGIDLTEKINGYDRYRVEFALRDQSTIAKNSFYNGFQSNQDILDEWERTKPDPVLPFDINSIVSRLAGGLAGGLAEHVYPYGGTNRAIKKGLITTAPSYNKMISMGDTPASNRRYAFNALHEYTTSSNFAADAPEIHSSLTGVYNTNLPNFLKGGWFESIVSNSNYYNIADYHLSYNIYARIVDTKDKINGNWLLIDKHGQPIGAQDDRMNGGYTSKPIKLPDFNPGTDWTDAPDDVDVPDDEIEDIDTVKDEPLGTGYDDGSDNSGSGTTNIYNNYTYNYDNRSWIENHYDNETVQDANEGIDWLKLFSGFFSIFLILFGPFLPEWAVVLVTVATPIILGLAIFKVIKGIIPFV